MAWIIDCLIQGRNRFHHCGWFHWPCMTCKMVALTTYCTTPWHHVSQLDLPVWPLAEHWKLVGFWEAAKRAAIGSASWSNQARNVLLVCFILLTCLVSWEIEVALEASVGESFEWLGSFSPSLAVFKADFWVVLVLSPDLIVDLRILLLVALIYALVMLCLEVASLQPNTSCPHLPLLLSA